MDPWFAGVYASILQLDFLIILIFSVICRRINLSSGVLEKFRIQHMLANAPTRNGKFFFSKYFGWPQRYWNNNVRCPLRSYAGHVFFTYSPLFGEEQDSETNRKKTIFAWSYLYTRNVNLHLGSWCATEFRCGGDNNTSGSVPKKGSSTVASGIGAGKEPSFSERGIHKYCSWNVPTRLIESPTLDPCVGICTVWVVTSSSHWLCSSF